MSEPRKIRASVLPTRFKPAEYARNVFHTSAETGTTKENITDQAYWTHVAQQMKRFDHIEVVEESGAWICELLVVSAKEHENKTKSVRVEILWFKELGVVMPQESEKKSNYEVKYRAEKEWSVIRRHDNEVMVEGLDTRIEAEEWVRDNATDVGSTKAA